MMTLSKIAKEAHVSVSTASKAFSGSPEVSEETRELVFQVAKAHGCFKKFFNAKYPKLVIAVIAPEFSSLYYTRYLAMIQQSLPNCELCVSTSNFSGACEKTLTDYYYKHSNVDGIILIDPAAEIPQNIEVPVAVLRGHKQNGTSLGGYPSVYIDYHEAMENALRYLQEKGVSSVGFLGEARTGGKEQLFRSTMTRLGIPLAESSIVHSPMRFEEGGYQGMELLLQQGKPPRALLCAYDNMAIGAMKCLTDRGYRIPEDVAILGMDDLPEARFLTPPLSSISSVPEARCRMVADTILKQINGEPVESQIAVKAQFHLRRSFCIDK